jgi:transposase
MGRFVEGSDRNQTTLFPECLDDWIDEDNPVRVIDAFVDAMDLGELGFDGVVPEATGRPAYHPSVLLKLYIYGYLNRVQSSRRGEREAGRNVEMMWLTGRLVPDHKTIADFRWSSSWDRIALGQEATRLEQRGFIFGHEMARGMLIEQRLEGNGWPPELLKDARGHPIQGALGELS